jgi:hypothetical protein
VARFGRDKVFMDVSGIPLGRDFRKHLNHEVGKCGVLLAVIGDYWLDARHEDGPRKGQRRLDDPGDFVRLEIEAALAREIPVVPVLVGRASMPHEKDLPDGLKALAYFQAAEVRAGPHFHDQAERLISGIEKYVRVEKQGAVKGGAVSGGEKKEDDEQQLEFDTDEVMAAFRQAARGQGWQERPELLKAVAQLLDQRVTPEVLDALKGHLRAAIRRKIIEAEGDMVRIGAATMAEYELEELRATLCSVMRPGRTYERQEVIHAVARYLGFVRVTDTVLQPIRTAINSSIRQGILGHAGDELWRE